MMSERILHAGLSQRELREHLDEDLSASDGMPERSVQPTTVGKRRGRLPRAIQDILREALG
ncbi:MAG: hypothetical protein Greene07147_389 [Parcubacteria group bacterium Greene0714_7]|nr:MAG: hypothetical protein Greene07147_389 [Parcubacteria group bacterium Greene0714_7]